MDNPLVHVVDLTFCRRTVLEERKDTEKWLAEQPLKDSEGKEVPIDGPASETSV